MGIWAEVKHAINSTLGTNDFKSLDKIIKGQRTYAASNALLAVLLHSSTAITTTKTTIPNVNFIPSVNGSLAVYLDIYEDYYPTSGNYVDFWIYENGVETASVRTMGNQFAYEETLTKTINIQIKKDKTYTFAIKSRYNDSLYLTSLRLHGSVVDLSMLSYND